MKLARISLALNRVSRLLAAVLAGGLLSAAALAGTVAGTVTNGTTGRPAVGVDVILLNLQGTMQPVATTKTDATGHYQLSSDLLGSGPMLLRAVYEGVNYHEPVTPGKTTADVQVFEPTDKTSAFTITAHAIILQPNNTTGLTIGEEFNITNNTQPPTAYYRSGGSFEFSVPEGAQVSSVTAAGASGMGVVQTTIDKGKGMKAIDFPFRPGTSLVRVTYQIPYSGKLELHNTSPYPATNVAFFAPPPMQLTASGFAPAGQTQGFNAYMRALVPANTQLVASVSGTAPPPPPSSQSQSDAAGDGAPPDNSQNASVNSRVDTPGAAATASVTTMPARLDSLKWIIVAGFAALFVLGAVFVMRRPQLAMAGADVTEVPTVISARPAVAPRKAAESATVADLDTAVSSSLDQLKDSLFRLELRRQAGTISEDDYARERQRIDQRLRELVQG